MKTQLIIRVFGVVQGVWFRKTTKEVADKLGISGVVMNEPDGSVYIKANGTENQLKDFLVFCKQGPENARVDHIHVEEEDPEEFSGFEIIH